MSTPIIEQIAEWLKSAINQIRIGDVYNCDLIAVRPKQINLTDDLLKQGNVLIFQDDPNQSGLTPQAITWEQPFLLLTMVYDNTSDPIETQINLVRSDIEKRLGLELLNPVAGKYCGGLAEFIQLGTPKYFDTERATGFSMTVTIRYSVCVNDPYTLAI